MRVGELLRFLLRRAGARVSDRQIVLEIYTLTRLYMEMPQSHLRSEAPNWLPGQDSNQLYYTQPINPRSSDVWAVPALIVPEYDEFVRVR